MSSVAAVTPVIAVVKAIAGTILSMTTLSEGMVLTFDELDAIPIAIVWLGRNTFSISKLKDRCYKFVEPMVSVNL